MTKESKFSRKVNSFQLTEFVQTLFLGSIWNLLIAVITF